MLLVGHSGGGMPVAQAADRIPDRIARVVYVESGPLPDGTAQFDTVPPEEQQRLRAAIGDGHLLPPPAWDPAADPTNLAGLDEPTLALLRARATPQPLRAATDPVRRTGGRPVPTALVASTFPLAVVRQMIDEGHPFFTGLADGQLFALPTGHWPMLSEPKALADVLDLPRARAGGRCTRERRRIGRPVPPAGPDVSAAAGRRSRRRPPPGPGRR